MTVRTENSKYFERGDTIKDSYDCLSGGEQELCYDSINPDNSYRALFTSYCHKDNNIFYSDSCQSSEYLFGCAGLKNARYCILNRQYAKDEYEKLIPQIIEKMKKDGAYGEFFSIELSPFGYNESIAQDEFSLLKEEVLARGLKWQDNLTKTQGKETLSIISDDINDVSDNILQEVLVCGSCNRNYQITKAELAFYRNNQIPIPRSCFFCRLSVLYKERGPVRSWIRKCQCAGETSENKVYTNTGDHIQHSKDQPCPNEFETTYAPERPEIVYCEACYLREVV